MRRLFFTFVLSLVASSAGADDRTFSIGSFERLRVDGPFEVRVETGKSPGARVSGDRRLIERLDLAVTGTTLVVRLGGEGWKESPATRGPTPVVTLTTPRLISAAINSGARVSIGRMAAQKLDLSITGAGSLSVAAVDTDQLAALLIGTGAVTVAGRANRARLVTNGPGMIDATGLKVNDLTVRLDGPGETRAAATYTAQVTSTGLGTVTVSGKPRCTVQAIANGPVSCGIAQDR